MRMRAELEIFPADQSAAASQPTIANVTVTF